MQKLDKMFIHVYRNGNFIGYVSSVSYKSGSFKVAKDKLLAKSYAKLDTAIRDVDAITVWGMQNGYAFMIV